jgi:hypothetical protein
MQSANSGNHAFDMKPSDFFIGVIDFFSVLLPGALVAYFLKGVLYEQLFGPGKIFPLPQSAIEGWIVFLVATYIVGNLIFLTASLILDRFVYDKLLRKSFEQKNLDLGYHAASLIRDQYLSTPSWIRDIIAAKRLSSANILALYKKEKKEIINTYKWSQQYLSMVAPDAVIDIKKFEADSKFFRSLVLALILISIVFFYNRDPASGTVFLFLAILSLVRYADLRYKSTERAYELVITVNHLEKRLPVQMDAPTLDTRIIFSAPNEVVELYARKVSALTDSGSGEILSIRPNQTWRGTKSIASETIFCLEGKAILKVKGIGNAEEQIVLSPGAIIDLPSNAAFETTNSRSESLLLLLVK